MLEIAPAVISTVAGEQTGAGLLSVKVGVGIRPTITSITVTQPLLSVTVIV